MTNRTRAKADALAGLDGVTSIALEERPNGNAEAAASARIVLIGVKPAMVPDLLVELAPHLAPGTVVVSLAAGVTIATFESLLGPDVAVLRSMPNTPAVVGAAVTGLAAGTTATPDDVAVVRALFETVGTVIEVPESQIDALSTISGSGPAYFFLLVEEFTKAAVGKGFDRAEARLMAEQTFIGAAALLRGVGRGSRRAAAARDESQGHDRAGDRGAAGRPYRRGVRRGDGCRPRPSPGAGRGRVSAPGQRDVVEQRRSRVSRQAAGA